jgi:hypothetical protein
LRNEETYPSSLGSFGMTAKSQGARKVERKTHP